MIDPYRMVFVNVCVSIVLFLGIFIFKFIYPKKKINLLFLLLIISFLPLISMLRKGTYESGDLSLHAMRSMSYFNILVNERTLPNWTPEFNAYHGDPHFLFAYLLPYFFASILHLVGFSFLTGIKIILASSFILSGVGMYIWIKNELGEKAAFISSIFYLYTPYHLVDTHFRVTVAESLSFSFLPFIMFFTKKVIEIKNIQWNIFLILSVAFLILSHQVISLSFLPIAILYGIFVWARRKGREIPEVIQYLITVFLGILLTSFYWLPILSEAKFTQNGSQYNSISYPQALDLLFSPWRYGLLFQGPMGELSYLLGYTQWFVVIAIMFLLVKKRIANKMRALSLLFLSLFLIILFLILPISKPIWDSIPLMNFFQFSTRFLVSISLCVAMLAGILVKKINKTWFLVVLSFLTIAYTVLNWGNRASIPNINDEYLKNEYAKKPDISGLEPSSPKWANIQKTTIRIIPTAPLEAIKGTIEYKQVFRNSTTHEYIIYAKTDSLIKENTLFFPGWNLYINNVKHAIIYDSEKYPGIVLFNLKKGLYKVEVIFKNTPVRTYARWISLFTFTSISIYTLLVLIKKNSKKQI